MPNSHAGFFRFSRSSDSGISNTNSDATSATAVAVGGLSQLTKVKHPRAALVFVHGLGGHPVKTWSFQRNADNFWPRYWLPAEDGFGDVQIFTFGYGADYATTKKSTASILDFSKKLNLELLSCNLQTLPLVLVTHSMGGLVVKKAIMMAIQDPLYHDVAESIKQGAVMFLATPHRGSDSASLLNRVLSLTVGSKRFVKELMRNSETLTLINEDFRHYATILSLWSFYETEPTSLGPRRSEIIVDKASAILGYGNEISAPIDADHHTICKFASRDSPGYRTIKSVLIRLLNKAPVAMRSSQSLLMPLSTTSLSSVYPPIERPTVRQKPLATRRQLSKLLGQEDTTQEDLLSFQDARQGLDSCQWIFQEEVYDWWIMDASVPETRFLCLKGPPAIGKSVLMSAVIDKLHEDGLRCAYYFFRTSNASKQNTRAFLLSLVFQLASQDPNFKDDVLDIHENDDQIPSMTTRVLWQRIFVETLFERILDMEPLYMVIDGLDEAENSTEVISYLAKIRSTLPLRIMISFRNGMEMDKCLFPLMRAAKSFRHQTIVPENTKNDMIAYITQSFESLPFSLEDRDDIVAMIVAKSQGLFLWVKVAVEEILSTVHSLEAIEPTLDLIPSELTEFFLRILDSMSQKLHPSNRRLAKDILGMALCSTRPLRIKELQTLLKPIHGNLASLKYSIDQVCPYLISIDDSTSTVQPRHSTIREFLLGDPPSEFAIDYQTANGTLAKLCLDMWNDKEFDEMISKQTARDSLDKLHPLLHYAAHSWFEHLHTATYSKEVVDSLLKFLRDKILYWMEVVGLLDQLRLVTRAAECLDFFAVNHQTLSDDQRALIVGWAVDLYRFVPKFGKDLVAHPFSIHKLLPPFCPYNTCIGRQSGLAGDIVIAGATMKNWDDCLAHFIVGKNGETCKAIVCGEEYLVISLADPQGTVDLFSTKTLQQVRRFHHGERVSAINLSDDEQRLVTAGRNVLKVWDTKTGAVLAKSQNDRGVNCLAVAFRRGNVVTSVASDDTLTTWNLADETLEVFRWTRPSTSTRHRGSPWGVTWSIDGSEVALAYKGWPVEIWDLDSREIKCTIPTRNPLRAIFSPSKDAIFTVDGDGTVTRFDCRLETTVEVDAQSHILAMNPQGSLLATGNGEGCLKIYNSTTMELLYQQDKFEDSITGLTFSPDGRRLYEIRASDCNIWDPEVLLISDASINSFKSLSSDSETLRPPFSSLLGSANAQYIINSMVSSPSGGYICCGKSNGRISIYETSTGKELQELYKHASTVSIVGLAWSVDGTFIASGDNGGRVIVTELSLISPKQWECQSKSDFRLNTNSHGGIRQLVLNHDASRILVSTQRADAVFDATTGSMVGDWVVRSTEEVPCWLMHPLDSTKLILICSEYAKVLHWQDLTQTTREVYIGDRVCKAGWSRTLEKSHVQTRAFATHEWKHLVSSTKSEENSSQATGCIIWPMSLLDAENDKNDEVVVVDDVGISTLLGVWRNRAVFLDTDRWVRSTGPMGKDHGTYHFLIPSEWLNTREQGAFLLTKTGQLVCTNEGKLVAVQKGMKSQVNPGLIGHQGR